MIDEDLAKARRDLLASNLGDLRAARRLVVCLERARDALEPLSPSRSVGSLTDDDFGAKGRRVRVLAVLQRSQVAGVSADALSLTLEQIARFQRARFLATPGCGALLADALERVLDRAGLRFAEGDGSRSELGRLADLIARMPKRAHSLPMADNSHPDQRGSARP